MANHPAMPASKPRRKPRRNKFSESPRQSRYLTREAEGELIIRSQATGDPQALADLWQAHHRAIWHQAALRRSRCTYVEVEDLVQVGFIKFRACVLSFDVASGNRLTTYYHRAIRQAMEMELTCNRNVYIPPAAHAAESTAVHAEKMRESVSFGRLIPALRDGNDSPIEWQRLAEPQDHDTPDLLAIDSENQAARQRLFARIRREVSALPDRERDVMRARMAGQILQEIGDRIGVSKERIRQIEKNAVAKLKKRLADCWDMIS